MVNEPLRNGTSVGALADGTASSGAPEEGNFLRVDDRNLRGHSRASECLYDEP